MIGKNISHYKVLKKLGEGGMGVVYRARDTKLGRDVAIKALPEEFERNLERLARFEREAKLLASLNHPSIAAIYGLEEHERLHFLILEMVEGKTLAEQLHAEPLKVQEALEICRQIAEALEAAHEKGIIHRDLKPSNVKVTPEGKVKVLDFGLAKAFEAADYGKASVVDLSKSPTITVERSSSGVILGTAAYMSPEQARGKPLDKRTDIWSFGCVLYEALTGHQAFEGETISDTIAAILEHEPKWMALPEETPVKIRDLLRRCLQKDTNRRFRDIADARIEIEEALSEISAPLPAMPEAKAEAQPVKRRRLFLLGLVAGLVVGAIAAGIAVWNLMRSTLSESQPIGRYTINLPQEAPVLIFDNCSVALSPDGTSIVYAALRGDNTQLYLRDIKQFEAKPIPGTENAHGPFFSPSGEWVGYFDYEAAKLMKVSLRGGAPIIICEAPSNSRGGSWGSDDSIVFTRSFNSGLYRVSAAGGTLQTITTLDPEKKEKTHRFPQILPDGKNVLFTIGTSEFTTYDDARIAVVSLETGKRKILVEGGSNARYLPSGHIVYARAGSLMAVPFDLKELEVTDSPVLILEGVVTADSFGAAQFNFSRNGSLIYVTGGPEIYYTKLVWVDRKGAIQSLPVNPRMFMGVLCSPDGKRLALHVSGGNDDIWIYEIERGTLTRLTAGGDHGMPTWTPDSNQVTYYTTRGGLYTLFRKPADGSGPAEKLLTSENNIYPSSWSPDGKMLAFNEIHPSTGADIWVLPIEGERKPRTFLKTPFNEYWAKFSPNGRWLAYTSNESGQYEVYVRPFPGPGRKWQISTRGGTNPVWAPDGRELFYAIEDKMMAVSIKTEPKFSAGKPKLLFKASSTKRYLRTYDLYGITPDGQRFVMIEGGELSTPPTQLNIVLNWFEELKRLVPSGN